MADSRTYIKVHDGMPDHPKIDGLSDAAFRLLVTTWCWCSRHLTDGHVPAATWKKRGTARTRGQLVAAGLVEEVTGGVRMHDYLQHQRSADEVAELRRKKQEAGSKGGRTRAANQADAKQVLKQTPSKPQAEAQAKSNTETEEVLRTSQTETEPVPPSAGRVAPRDTAQALIADWIEHVPKRPPGNVVGQVSKHIKAMLAEGVDPLDIRRGLAAWVGKGLHPSTLPSVVNEVMNGSPLAAAARPATTDVRVAQAQALKSRYTDRPPTVRGEIAG
jgi:hypothetical protein